MAEVSEPAEVNVFYGGVAFAGAMTSMDALGPLEPSLQGTSPYDKAARAMRSFVWRNEGRAYRVRAMSDYRNKYYLKSLREGMTHPDEQTRVWCMRAVEFLPSAHGVVFVADSESFRAEANVERLERTIDDLQAAGRRVDQVPFVFQLNKRDLPEVLSPAELAGLFKTPWCSYVESVATQGRGVHEALATLMAMIDERR